MNVAAPAFDSVGDDVTIFNPDDDRSIDINVSTRCCTAAEIRLGIGPTSLTEATGRRGDRLRDVPCGLGRVLPYEDLEIRLWLNPKFRTGGDITLWRKLRSKEPEFPTEIKPRSRTIS